MQNGLQLPSKTSDNHVVILSTTGYPCIYINLEPIKCWWEGSYDYSIVIKTSEKGSVILMCNMGSVN